MAPKCIRGMPWTPFVSNRLDETAVAAKSLLERSAAAHRGAQPKAAASAPPWRRVQTLDAANELECLSRVSNRSAAFEVTRHVTVVEGRPVVALNVVALFSFWFILRVDHPTSPSV